MTVNVVACRNSLTRFFQCNQLAEFSIVGDEDHLARDKVESAFKRERSGNRLFAASHAFFALTPATLVIHGV